MWRISSRSGGCGLCGVKTDEVHSELASILDTPVVPLIRLVPLGGVTYGVIGGVQCSQGQDFRYWLGGIGCGGRAVDIRTEVATIALCYWWEYGTMISCRAQCT
jgi:hypothetical protein